MAGSDSVLVRLPKTAAERLDARRGKVPRATFLATLIEDGRLPVVVPERPGDVKPGECVHPVNLRLGDRCAACGATISAKRR